MKLILSLLLTLSFLAPQSSWAQAEGEEDIVANTTNDIILIAAAGVGGAVLGLSTLSFYDEPSKHLSNVWTGAAVGIIAGVIVVALTHAQKSQEDLSTRYVPQPDFSTGERSLWHIAQVDVQAAPQTEVVTPIWGMSF